jgi:hypothetical protein
MIQLYLLCIYFKQIVYNYFVLIKFPFLFYFAYKANPLSIVQFFFIANYFKKV